MTIHLINLFDHREMLLERNPYLSIYYGDLPKPFVDIVKENTGLEGYDLIDKIDEIIFDAIGELDLAGWCELQFAILEERQKKRKAMTTYILLSMAVLGALPAITAAFTAGSSAMLSTEATTLSTLSKLKLGAIAFANSISASFKGLLSAIHFDTIARVHRIAEIVSPSYREKIRGLYGEISAISEALGFGPYFLNLAMQNMRTLVLDASTLLGMKYDMSEVQWLSSFQGYLKKFSGAAYRYANDPEALFFDMARWVEKPVLDNKGTFVEGLLTTIDHTLESVETVVHDIVTVRDDLDRFVTQLPEKIRDDIEPLVRPYLQKFDDFKEKNYDPFEKEINRVLDAFTIEQEEHRIRMADVLERMRRPGTLLKGIDGLTLPERFEEEDIIGEIASRSSFRGSEESESLREDRAERMLLILDALREERERIPWYVDEMETPSRPARTAGTPRNTWYVGDY